MTQINEPVKTEVEGVVPIRPCRHMSRWLSALSDNSLTGPIRWYALLHVSGCHRCQAALRSLEQLRARLRALGGPAVSGPDETLTDDRRNSLEASLDRIDREHKHV